MNRTAPVSVIRWIVFACVAIALFAVTVPIHAALYATFVPFAFGFGALVCGSLVLTPTAPRTAIALFMVGAFGLATTAGVGRDPFWPWPWSVPMLIGFALLVSATAYYSGWLTGLVAWLTGLAVSIVASLFRPPPSTAADAVVTDLIVAFSIAGAVYFIALLLAGRQRIRAELVRERQVSSEEQARRLLVEERARIAREMHDVVAHSMSLIQVQASTARYRLPELDAAAAAEFDDIAASARTSLTEMRRLLGALRTEDQSAERMPQQTVADIPALVDTARRAGVDIELDCVTNTDDIPASVQVAAFRIVQEAISNAVRHSPGSRVSVSMTKHAAHLVIDVTNTAPTSVPQPAPGGGHGLVGMRERTALLGGALDTQPTPEGGWLVHATLPCDTVDAASTGPEESA